MATYTYKNARLAVGTSYSTVYTCPAGTQAPAGARFSVRFAPAAAADLTTA